MSEPSRPVPDGIVLTDYTEDVDLGVLKTGKEADVHLIERRGGARSCLLARKVYRPWDERGFRNDAAYRAHRRIDGLARDRGGALRQRSQGRALQLAMDKKTAFGRKALHQQWIRTEWAMLQRLWDAGAPVPYPVGRSDDAIVMQYIGEADEAAPRLSSVRVDRTGAERLYDQARAALLAFARVGIVHADLSAYNILVWRDDLWVIDLPQAVPYLESMDATEFLHRDCVNVATWFVRKGVDVDPEDLFVEALDALFAYQMEDMFQAHAD